MIKFKKIYFIILFIVIIGALVYAKVFESASQKNRRDEMIKEQLLTRGIKDPLVLKAMKDVPRHLFVSKGFEQYAYDDGPLPIGFGQTISQPYIVALMTEALKLSKKSKVLEIGTGSGYQAAILSCIAKEVYTIEIVPELYEISSKLLAELGYKNIKTKQGDGYIGWQDFAPYDAIIVTCAAEKVPEQLVEQLKIGGRMCIPIGFEGDVQKLMLIEKGKDRIIEKIITYVKFVPFIHQEE